MSNSVDKRVVQMEFDNQKFEGNVQNSVRSLDTLKKSLRLEESARSLNNLHAAGRNFSLEGISAGVEALTNRFSTLGIVGMTIIQNLTNTALRFGNQLIGTLVTQPLKMGLQEYETQLNAIQTVLANTASKGTTLSDVSAALDELNEYADKTIYNFTEMTRNIGTFTAAGVSLETSTSAIKGIANLAAVSGSNAQQASTAMYQLSQAMASGTVKLMDWNSVVNAGMGGQVFQDALKETARVHKVNIDAMIKKEGSFRETLQNGWLTTEILTETLSKFTGDLNAEQLKSMGYTQEQITEIIKLGNTANDAATKVKTFSQLQSTLKEAMQSGWTKTWQLIIGDFEQAKTFWTDINNVFSNLISASSDSRNNLIQDWQDLGGRSILLDGVKNTISVLIKFVNILSEAFSEIFPPITARNLYDIVGAFWLFIDGISDFLRDSDTVKRTFKGLAAFIDIVRMGVVALIKPFLDLARSFLPSGEGILNFTANLGDYIVRLRESIIANDSFNKGIQKIKEFISAAILKLKAFSDFVAPFLETVKSFFSDTFKDVDTSGVESFVSKLKVRFSPLVSLFEGVGRVFSWLGKVLEKLSPLFFKLAGIVSKAVGNFAGDILTGIDNLDFNNVFDTINGGLLAALILAVKKFVENGSGVFSGIKGILDGVQGSLQAWQENLKANTLLTIAAAIGIMALAIIGLSLVDSTKLTASLTAVTVMFGQLIAAMAAFEKIPGGGGIAKTAASLILLSVSILLITAAVKSLSDLKPEELTNGLIGVGVILGELLAFMKLSNLDGMGSVKGAGLVLLATSLLILASAVDKIGSLKPEKLKQGLMGMAAILSEIAIFSKVTANSKNLISTALGLTVLSIGLNILALAVERMGSLTGDQIGKGLATMAASLLILGIAMNSMPKDMVLTGTGLGIVATSLVILSQALSIMGQMSWEEIARGMTVLSAAMVVLTVTMKALGFQAVPGAIAMAIMAGAILMLTPALKALGKMSLEEIGLALLTLAGAFTIIGLAGLILTPVIPSILALAGAMLLFGVGATAVGAGILAFSAGLAALSVSGAAGAAALVVIITSIIGLIPMVAQRIAEALVDFAMVIREGAPIIGQAVVVILSTIIGVIMAIAPQLAVAVVSLITTILTTIAANIPTIVQAGFDILIGLLQGIANNIGKVVETAIDIVLNFIEGVANKIPDIVIAGIDLIVAFIDGLTLGVEEGLPRILEAIENLGKAIIEGLVKGIQDNATQVFDAIVEVAKNSWGALKEALGINSPSKVFMEGGMGIDEGMALGITKFSNLVTDAVTDMGNKAVSSMSKIVGDISDSLNTEMNFSPTIKPVVDLTEVVSGSKEINRLLTNKTLDITVGQTKAAVIATSSNEQKNVAANSQINQPVQGANISFTQNNYSPTALSRLEIYRQTKTQLLLLKGFSG